MSLMVYTGKNDWGSSTLQLPYMARRCSSAVFLGAAPKNTLYIPPLTKTRLSWSLEKESNVKVWKCKGAVEAAGYLKSSGRNYYEWVKVKERRDGEMFGSSAAEVAAETESAESGKANQKYEMGPTYLKLRRYLDRGQAILLEATFYLLLYGCQFVHWTCKILFPGIRD